jgi:hypothetical protein
MSLPANPLSLSENALLGPVQNLRIGSVSTHRFASMFAVATEAFRVEQKTMTGFPRPCLAMTSGILVDYQALSNCVGHTYCWVSIASKAKSLLLDSKP